MHSPSDIGAGNPLDRILAENILHANVGRVHEFSAADALPEDHPDYIALSGLTPEAFEWKTNLGAQVYSRVMLAHRNEPVGQTTGELADRYRAVLVASIDKLKEKHVERWLKERHPYPAAVPPKTQVPAFKARDHNDVHKVVPVRAGHISPFTLGEKFRPGEHHADAQHVSAVSGVMLVRPEKDGREHVVFPIGPYRYLQLETARYHALLDQLSVVDGCHIIDPSRVDANQKQPALAG